MMLLDCGSRQLQDLLPHRQLQRFQIQVFHRLTTEQRFNLLHDVAGQEIGEEVFYTPCATIASGCRSWALQSVLCAFMAGNAHIMLS